MNSGGSPNSESINVLTMPDYRVDNPYQMLLEKALVKQGVTVKFPWGYRRVFPIFRMATDSKHFQHSFEVLHLHWISPYFKGDGWVKVIYALKFLLDIWMTRLAGIGIVWTVHNRISHDSNALNVELWARRILVKLVDRVILHNYSVVEAIAQDYQFNPAKAVVIPIGHYKAVYQPPIEPMAARRALGLPLTGLIYLNQGMLRPYKGVEQLLEVWHNTPEMQDNTLVIAGKPLDETYGTSIAQLASHSSNVRLYPHFIEDDQMHLFFSAADIVVLPFTTILTSSSLIVAMSYGKPVVAPKLGGIPETIGHADQLLYNPEELDGLQRALVKSTHIDLKALSQQVQQECDRLNWDDIGEKTKQLYKTVIYL
ncbi:MAG: glycosyltransferase [Oculatellaceae cyanobacterium bins.114]|nr:glycosyltransferase [Oculatellaceae cyanobacterium bins.114]